MHLVSLEFDEEKKKKNASSFPINCVAWRALGLEPRLFSRYSKSAHALPQHTFSELHIPNVQSRNPCESPAILRARAHVIIFFANSISNSKSIDLFTFSAVHDAC